MTKKSIIFVRLSAKIALTTSRQNTLKITSARID